MNIQPSELWDMDDEDLAFWMDRLKEVRPDAFK